MTLSDAPLIAVNGFFGLTPEPMLRVATRYTNALRAAGAIPLALPPHGPPDELAAWLERVDGLLLTGGDDFDTARLGLGPTHPAATPMPPEKQDSDLALARLAIETGLPVLGICYGMQLLGLDAGADLLQHLPDDRPGCQPHAGGAVHPIRCQPGTKLRALTGIDSFPVVSRHHQALTEPAAPWRAAARDLEGLLEAIEHESHPFAIGVQWHPELSTQDAPHGRLFEGLVEAARLHRRARALPTRG